jgi:hypothetical protein
VLSRVFALVILVVAGGCAADDSSGMLFIPSPPAGCGIERYHCNNG